MQTIASLCALALAVTFGWAALAKVVDPRAWVEGLHAYRFGPAARPIAVMTPLLEVAVVVLVLAGETRAGAALALASLAAFCLALLRARKVAGDRLPCACFGRAKVRDYRLLLIRNAVLAVLAAVVLLPGRDVSPAGMIGDRDLFPFLLTVLAIGVLGWVATQTAGALRRDQR